MNTQSLEQNKTNLKTLETKLDDLQLKRRELFNQLKKVLNEETTLKKNNRPPITLTPQANSIMPIINGYQQMMGAQEGIFPISIPGPPQLINQPNGGVAAPSAKTPPNSSILPGGILSPSMPTSTATAQHAHLTQTKPQSPFHPPQLLHHLGQNFPLIPPGSLKYGIPTPLSPQILTAHQHASPSSSPRHQIPTPNQTNSTPNSKRPRSPSPQTSASPHSSSLSQFVFNQTQLTPSRSPATHAAQSPPPSALRDQMFSNSPSANKKTRSNLTMSSSSPSLNQNERQHQREPRQNTQPFLQGSGLTPQQQSAFSAYHQSLITGRPGPLNPQFQPPPTSHSKPNKSPNPQSFQPQSRLENFPRGNAGNLQPPTLPPPSQSPLNFNTMTNHYLNQLAKEATQKIFQQQQQQSLQQHLIQQQQQFQMLSATAAAAAAATQHQEREQRESRSTGSSAGSGGGSILTGFSRSSSNPSQQRPPSNY